MKSADSSRAVPTRRQFLQGSLLSGAAALSGGALLSACGSGEIASALVPTRFVVLGDGMSFLGAARYTVNDGSVNNWAAQLASRFNFTLTAGDSFAAGDATVADIATQITASGTPTAGTVYLINAPMKDIFDNAASTTAAATAGTALAGHVRGLITAGAQYVMLVGLYDLGKSPAAIALTQQTAYSAATLAFNNAFKTAAVNLGTNLLYHDLAHYINGVVSSPSSYSLGNATEAVCTSPSVTTCTTSTLVSGANHDTYLFADDRHFTPIGHRLIGNDAFTALTNRW